MKALCTRWRHIFPWFTLVTRFPALSFPVVAAGFCWSQGFIGRLQWLLWFKSWTTFILINLVSLSALKNLYVWSSPSPASHQAQVCETQTGRKTRYGNISVGWWWGNFLRREVFFSTLGSAWFVFYFGRWWLLCKIFFLKTWFAKSACFTFFLPCFPLHNCFFQ